MPPHGEALKRSPASVVRSSSIPALQKAQLAAGLPHWPVVSIAPVLCCTLCPPPATCDAGAAGIVSTIHVVTIIKTHSRNLRKNYICLAIPFSRPDAIRKTATSRPVCTTDLTPASPESASTSRMCHVIQTGLEKLVGRSMDIPMSGFARHTALSPRGSICRTALRTPSGGQGYVSQPSFASPAALVAWRCRRKPPAGVWGCPPVP